jgi:hypothetical protein
LVLEDFDITEFAKMFDAALASDNPAVKKALRNFMMVAAIVHAQELNEDKRLAGPFESLLKKVQDLESMMRELQNNRTYKDNYRDYYKDYVGTNPTWVSQPYTKSTTNGTSSDAKTWKSTYNGQPIESSEIYELLKDLKFK